MNDDMDMKDSLVEDDGHDRDAVYWLPRLVVLTTLIGFFALAWYAYRTGTQSVNEEDLIVVAADQSPIKEKPDDPGGMRFPNQDKTVFDTFANNPQQPPRVERVLPGPEEPMMRDMDTSGTTTWVNDKLKREASPAAGETEQVIGSGSGQPLPEPAKELPPMPENTPSPIDSKSKPVNSSIESFTAEKQAAPEPKVEEPKTEVKAEPKPEPKVVETPKPAATGKVQIQLGAYRGEKEAKDAFTKIQNKFASLSGKSPTIQKADLGDKGIFYRLRVGGFASSDQAADFCKSLSAKGQACIVAK